MVDAIFRVKKDIFLYICLLLICIGVFFASWWMLNGNIDFHTDIARDFLLFEDIYFNKNITLLGPRSGGISGVFHGPLWLYINIPAYAIGMGSPVVVGWFWVLLYLVSIGVVFYISKQLFGGNAALVSSSIYSISTASTVPFFFNPFGAVVLAPIFFYATWMYMQKHHVGFLSVALLSLGFAIQFQMAWAMPMLVLVVPIYMYLIHKYRKYSHLLAYFLLIIPLSSFILFELRNDFLQSRSVITYLSGGVNATKIDTPLYLFFWKRIVAMTYEAIGLCTGYTTFVTFLIIGLFIYFYKSTTKYKNILLLFLYLYVGFWLITLPYKGTIWGYYYWPFVSIISVIMGIMLTSLHRVLFIVVFALIYLVNAWYAFTILSKPFAADDTSLWQFYHTAARTVYNDAPEEFGYYIYTTDQFGYSTRYGMNYVQRQTESKKSYPFEKKAVTYLLIDDPGNHTYTNHKGWKEYDVKIQKKPVKKIRLSKHFWIEKYELTTEEMAIPSNPNLIQNLIFR